MTTGWKQSQPGPPGRAVQAGAPVAASPLRASRNRQVGGQWPSGWGGGGGADPPLHAHLVWHWRPRTSRHLKTTHALEGGGNRCRPPVALGEGA